MILEPLSITLKVSRRPLLPYSHILLTNRQTDATENNTSLPAIVPGGIVNWLIIKWAAGRYECSGHARFVARWKRCTPRAPPVFLVLIAAILPFRLPL